MFHWISNRRFMFHRISIEDPCSTGYQPRIHVPPDINQGSMFPPDINQGFMFHRISTKDPCSTGYQPRIHVPLDIN
ncbi:hypothetical protein NHX12_001501 [Muraenolepis orangiensis]|uniref:Uncharacterized protein n=1 Tax=Muraenolepis orangiensis TaxID=630683 RepID=A0A9Q0II78_9TELE|nr:hypothetical protein NHX12_001501 [Muraenolepis orangiensis]